MNLEQARVRLENLIQTGGTHPDYQRTIDHAVKCRKMATGDVLSLLRKSPNDQDFEAKAAIYITTIPAVWHELRTPFYQVAQLSGSDVERRFDFPEGTSDDERARLTARILDAVDHYYADQPLEDYLSERVVKSIAMTDPNAWLLTTFAPFDFRTQAPKPYPVLFPCEAVIDFSREAGNVTSMSARFEVSLPGAAQHRFRYACYLKDELLDYWPILDVRGVPTSTLPEGATVYAELRDGNGALTHQARVLRHACGRVPAEPIGYEPDEQTDGRTFVSPLNPALCFLEKELNTGAELDIVMSKVVHPHKSQFVPACPGIAARTCVAGKDPTSQQPCGICHGTSAAPVISTSALQVNTYPLPANIEDMGKMPDLSKMVHFSSPDINIPKFQVEYQEWLVARAHRTLFNTDSLTKTNIATTATERLAQNAQKNVSLYPLARNISRTYIHHSLVCAAIVDAYREGLAAVYEIPKGLLPPSLEDLETTFAEAVKAGLPAMYLEDKFKDVVRRKFADDPIGRKKMEVKMRFIPFLGMSEEFVLKLAGSSYISAEQRVLRTHQDSIFWAVEQQSPGFYELPPTSQQAIVDNVVKELITGLPSTAAPAASATFPRFTPPAPLTGTPTSYPVGSRVRVRPEMEHAMGGMTMGGAGTVELVSPTPALGVRLDAMPDEVHKWYVDSEVQPVT